MMPRYTVGLNSKPPTIIAINAHARYLCCFVRISVEMTENRYRSAYVSFTPLSPETKSITSGFSFTRLFDFSWRKEKADSVGGTNLEGPYKEGDNEGEGKKTLQNQIPAITVTPDKKADASDETSGGIILNGSHAGYGKSKSADNSPRLPRKDKGKYRNVKTILRRLSAIAVDKKWHQSSGDFRPNFKQYWMPDEHCKECYECSGKFSMLRRRHHCRVCGQIFCSRCCGQEVPGQNMGFSGNIRVCNYCYKIMKAYVEDDIDRSLEALKEDMSKCSDDLSASEPFGSIPSSLAGSRSNLSTFEPTIRGVGSTNSLPGIIERDLRSQKSVPHYPFDAFGVTPQEAKDIKQDFLRDLWRQITDTGSKLELQSHRFRLKTYPNCFVGHELVDWLLTYGKAANRAQGVAIGQDLLDFDWIESVPATEEDVFKDEYLLYQPGKLAMPEMESQASLYRQELDEASQIDAGDDDERTVSSVSITADDDDDETVPIWFRQISSADSVTITDIMESQAIGTPSLGRRISSSRHLDLDHVTFEPGEGKERTLGREISLQMSLDYFDDEDENEKQVRKEIYDQTNKLSLITHVPPPPLDTYVCVEGHPFVAKKKIPKVPSVSTFAEDIFRGIEFPKPRSIGLREPVKDDNGESAAREKFRIAAEHHLFALLNQLIQRDKLATVWKDAIMPIVLQISEQVVPDVRRDDDMDIRHYVWFKKVPIGDRPDVQVVSGVVFPKNVVHKKMNCSFTHPKILMLSCAIEYQRVENKLTSIDPVVLQEYEFLKNFIARVISLKPNIVLVEKTVARVAQDMLLAAGITLVHNIKSNVMENISRCTGADVLQSMEQVSRPRLGSCQQFRLQKYHLPDGGSKTLMFFEGCPPDLGCSLVLQGGDMATLTKVKAIMKYLIYAAYHLKLESKFLMDEFALPPPMEDKISHGHGQEGKTRLAVFKIAEEDLELESEETVSEDSKAKSENDKTIDMCSKSTEDVMLVESKKFGDLLSETLLSSSPFCRYPLPYLLTEEGRNCSCRRFIPDQIYISDLLNNKWPVKEQSNKGAILGNEKEVNSNLIFKDPHNFTQSSIIPCPQDQTTRCLLADFRARGGLVDLQTYRDFEKLHRERRKEVNIKRRREFEQVAKKDEEMDSLVAAIASKEKKQNLSNDEDDEKLDCFNPYNHQRIAVLISSYSSESHNAPKPCISPWAVFMEFYGSKDITLGGFLERYCFRPSYICYSHNCDIEMIKHVRYFAHGNGSLYIHMRNLDSPIPGYDRTILTWSWCKQCKQVTPVVPLSFESWSLSFAKYLELRFYGGKYTRRASAEPCGHSLHQDHYQYFSFANMVASFKYRPIELYEVILPNTEVVIGKERDPPEWYNDVEKFSKTAEIVLSQIAERINDLRNLELGSNIVKEMRMKGFYSEFQAESYHYHEFVQCLQVKVDSLLKSQNKSHLYDPLRPSSQTDGQDDDDLQLKPSEVSALMMEIGNMLIKLKKQLCEIVLSWNARLQEYIQQEKRREKTTKLSSSPRNEDLRYVPSNVPSDIREFHPSAIQGEDVANSVDNQKYAYIHAQGASDSVSEVLLGNGAILRQTYIGTQPPLDYITTEMDNQELVTSDKEAVKGGEEAEVEEQIPLKADIGDDIEVKCHSEAEYEDEAGKEIVDSSVSDRSETKDTEDEFRVDTSCKAGSIEIEAIDNGIEAKEKKSEGHVRSPYAVAESPLVRNKLSKRGDLGAEQIDSPSDNIKAMNNQVDGNRSSGCTKAQKKDAHLKRTGSVNVERGSISDINLELEKQKTISRMASEDSFCSNDSKGHWMAESRDRTVTVINTFESEDFPKYLRRKLAGTSQSDDYISSHPSSVCAEDGSDADQSDLISMQDVLDFADDDQSYLSDDDDDNDDDDDLKDTDDVSEIGLGESAVDYETIVIEDEFVDGTALKGQDVPFDVTPQSPVGSSSKNKKLTENTRDHAQEQFSRPGGSKLTNSNTEPRQSQKSKYPPLGAQNEIPNYFSEHDSSPSFGDRDVGLLPREPRGISGKTDERKPLFDLEDSESEDQRYDSVCERNEKSKQVMKANEVVHEEIDSGKRAQDDEKEFKRMEFAGNRAFGHRRLQSAPLIYSPKKEAAENTVAECDLPGSPFELLKHTSVHDQAPVRVRSYSYGNTFADGQEELTRIAERICQFDRKDLEMDDPEEIQYDESLEEYVKDKLEGSSTAGSEKKAKEVSDLTEDESERKLRKMKNLKGESEPDESERDSGSSASTYNKKYGHSRNLSLQYNRIGILDSKEDMDSQKLSSSEAAQSSQGQKKGAEKVKKIISHFMPGSNFQTVPNPFPSNEHYLLPPGDSVSVVINEQEPSSIIAYALSSVDYFNQLASLNKQLFAPTIESDTPQHSPSPQKKEGDFLQFIPPEVVLRNRKQASKNSKRPSSWAGVSSKLPFFEYQINCQLDLMQRDNPSFGSASSGLDSKPPLQRNRMHSVEQYLVSSSGASEKYTSNDTLDSPADFDDGRASSVDGLLDDKDDAGSLISEARPDQPEGKSGKKKDEGKSTIDYNIKLQFHDNSAKFFCNVYYAEQFRCLRQLIFPEGEERYIQSLARCVFWKARGGKSGSSFSKSLDDRFVMKQMSRLEVQSFVELAPHYFHYMDKALREQRPTTLAKILGVYGIGFKNSQTGREMRQDVLIMENVFYNRKVNKIFDLKGSVRSRYVHNSGKEEVLMDENLLEMICDTPLFIRPHSKVVLSKAIHNDSEFLASHSVMDYSLLVGIDEINLELVVGIIDYIRTFTWDKKLESYVKSTGILGGQGKMPTVVSPAVYRTRFAEAMHRYFLMVPDKWTGFGADLS